MKKLILECPLSPGDIVMLTAAVRDLHRACPGRFATDVRTRCQALWQYNPWLTPLREDDPEVEVIACDYPLINASNHTPYHCLHGFIDFLNDRLGLNIRPTLFQGDIHLAPHEKAWFSQVHELTGEDTPFWIIVAGGKPDITIKWWSAGRYQAVVDHFRGRIQFVQVGEARHHHPPLRGVIDLRGRTDLRQLVRLVHHAQGVLCPVTSLMHLAAAVETRPGRAPRRPCVVVAGGREPVNWEAYPHHQFIHTIGALPCCATGGCWKARTHPLGDGDERDKPEALCVDVRGELPRCMDLISARDVCRRIETYFAGGQAQFLTRAQAQAAERGVALTEAAPVPALSAPSPFPRRGALLIQQAAGPHMQMLEATAGWHNDYAVRHGFEFWSVRGHVQTERPAHWDKIILLQRALAQGYELVVWLDADTLIVRPEVDLREALPADGPPIGMCRHPMHFREQPWHFNSGVMIVRNTPLARAFFQNVWQAGPNNTAWQEQIAINELSQRTPGAVQRISDRWNCTLDATDHPDPVIRAWHGLRMGGLRHLRAALAGCLARKQQEQGATRNPDAQLGHPASAEGERENSPKPLASDASRLRTGAPTSGTARRGKHTGAVPEAGAPAQGQDAGAPARGQGKSKTLHVSRRKNAGEIVSASRS
jgi:ADP-heptose:LPS heptosyltransferase